MISDLSRLVTCISFAPLKAHRADCGGGLLPLAFDLARSGCCCNSVNFSVLVGRYGNVAS